MSVTSLSKGEGACHKDWIEHVFNMHAVFTKDITNKSQEKHTYPISKPGDNL